MDVKHIDPVEHRKLTGQPNDNIIEMFRYLSDIDKAIWIRYVLIPGITDNDEYLKKTGKFISSLQNVKKIEVLPYHSMGEFKWEQLGLSYSLKGVKTPDKEKVRYAEMVLRSEIVEQ